MTEDLGTRRPDEATDVLCAEMLRRDTRFEQLRDDPNASDAVRHQVCGEVIGLRGALGIVLGGTVPGGSADRLGASCYQAWLKRREQGE